MPELIFIGIFAVATGWIGWKLQRSVSDRKKISELETKLENARKAREIRQNNDSLSGADIDDKLQGIYRD
jgi:hypothetical protein